jgi:hypothetical protein
MEKPLAMPRRRSEENTVVVLIAGSGWGFVNSVINLRFP